MGNNRSKTKGRKQEKPKEVIVLLEEGDYKLYRKWASGKLSQDPFFISDSAQEMIEKYNICCKQWEIKPNIEMIKRLLPKE